MIEASYAFGRFHTAEMTAAGAANVSFLFAVEFLPLKFILFESSIVV